MTLDNIFKTGEMVCSKKDGSRATYTVKVTMQNTRAAIYFRNDAYNLFKEKRIVPIIVNTSAAKRIYFAPEEKVNASDAKRNPGYKVSLNSKGEGGHIQIQNDAERFEDFVGSYKKVYLDGDCMLYFIERPTTF